MIDIIKKDIEDITSMIDSYKNSYYVSPYTNRPRELQEKLIKKYKYKIEYIGEDLYHSDGKPIRWNIIKGYCDNLEIIKLRLEFFMSEQKSIEGRNMSPNTPSINIVNNNNNNLSNTNTNSLDINLLFKEARNKISEDVNLNDNEVEEILNKINELEILHNSNENIRNKWGKSKKVMTWLFGKSPKIASIILPLITEIIKFNNK